MNFDDTCYNWVQIIKKSDLPANAKYLAFYLNSFMNMEQDIAWPSMARISHETGLSPSTCRKWLKWMDENGWLSVARNAKPVSGKSGTQMHNEYHITFPDEMERGAVIHTPLQKGGLTVDQRGSNCRSKGGRSLTPNINKNINKNNNGRFTPPTLKEVTEYCQSRNNAVKPQSFLDHYEANGWVRGKTKMKDWKACVRTWETNNPVPEKTYDPLENYV